MRDENLLIAPSTMHLVRRMRLNSTLRAFGKLIRLPHLLTLDLLCVLSMVTFQKGFYNPVLIGVAVLTMTFISAGSAAINDYFDRESDAITHPERPIPSRQVSPSIALRLAGLTFLIGLGIALTLNSLAFAIIALNVVLFTVYSPILKRAGRFLSYLAIGYLASTSALFAGAVVFQSINVASVSFVCMTAAGAFGLNVLRDVLSLEGDKKVGYSTFAANHGTQSAAIFGALVLLFAAATSPLPYVVGVVNAAYLFLIVLWSVIVFFVVVSLLRAPDAQNVKRQLRIFTMSVVLYPIALAANVVFLLVFQSGALI